METGKRAESGLMQHDQRARGRGEYGGRISHPEILGRGLDFHRPWNWVFIQGRPSLQGARSFPDHI